MSKHLCRDSLTSAHHRLRVSACCAILYAYQTKEEQLRLKETTFCINDKPIKSLLWCNKVPKGKRNKPAKINGIQHHEIADSAEHTYYQPVQ